MENCTIYSHYLDFDKVIEIVQNKLPKAKVETSNEGVRKSLVATVKGGFFSKDKQLKINYRQRQNPSFKLDQIECGLTQNLMGMSNFIQSLPAKNAGVRNKFIYKVHAANCEMAFIAEPSITKEFEQVLLDILNALDGFIFAQPSALFSKSSGQHFLDKNLSLIIDTTGNCEIQDIEVNVDSKYHDEPKENYTEEQKTRKEESEKYLENHGIKINRNLPCSSSSENTKLRSAEDIIGRIYALLIIAAKGEGIEHEYLARAVQDKQINTFSPRENYIYQAMELDDQERAYATWRYESLYTLLWAAGQMDTLKYPDDICDVQAVVGKVFKPSRKEFEDSVRIRPIKEILDERDKIYRMNWACVDARIKGEPVTGNINSSVVYERHYALNWLVNHQNQAWDDMQTNT